MKKRKEKKAVEFHQHHDEYENIFGKKHPLNAFHKNKKTQKKHYFSVMAFKREIRDNIVT